MGWITRVTIAFKLYVEGGNVGNKQHFFRNGILAKYYRDGWAFLVVGDIQSILE